MATPKKTGRPKTTNGYRHNMNIWLNEVDVENIRHIANAHGLSKCAAVRMCILSMREKMDREESRPLLPAVGS